MPPFDATRSSSKISRVLVYGKYVAAPEAAGEVAVDLPVEARVAGWIDRGVDLHDAAFGRADDALVLFLERAGQHDIGVEGGLGQEEVDDAEELEPVERLGGEAGLGERHDGVEADREQSLDLARVDRLHDLLGGEAAPRDVGRIAAPYGRDVLPVLGVLDVACAGKLLGLLAVLAATLAVALAGDHADALSRAARCGRSRARG